jgi:hypothetical protein
MYFVTFNEEPGNCRALLYSMHSFAAKAVLQDADNAGSRPTPMA